MRDLHSNLKTVLTLDPKLTAETRYGAPVDRRGNLSGSSDSPNQWS